MSVPPSGGAQVYYGCLRHLSSLLTRCLVLGSLTQILHSLVFGQEVLLLSHLLSIHPLVQQLPIDRTRGRVGDCQYVTSGDI